MCIQPFETNSQSPRRGRAVRWRLQFIAAIMLLLFPQAVHAHRATAPAATPNAARIFPDRWDEDWSVLAIRLARDLVNSVGKDTIAKEQRLVRLAQPVQRGAGDAVTPQANDIEPSKHRDLALGKPNGTMLPVTPLTPPTMAPSPICTN